MGEEKDTSLLESYIALKRDYDQLLLSYQTLQQQLNEAITSNEKMKDSEVKLTHLAYHDALTGLPNKIALYENVNKAFLAEGSKFALLYIDIDKFKYINDGMGHVFGDHLTQQAGERLVSLLKEGCSVYKTNGDEFVFVVDNVQHSLDAEVYASHIMAGFKEAFYIMDTSIHISVSIGIVIYPEHGVNIDELIKFADMAMYKAKEAGRNRYAVYDKNMNEAFMEKLKMESHLHKALENNEFVLYYQPQLELKTGRITGLEALLRWNSPELGFVSPNQFIQTAEETRLIIPLGSWVLRSACIYLKKLHNEGYTNLGMSVNISMLQLLQTNFVDMVIDFLEVVDLRPSFLELEITESIMMESYETIYEKLVRLKQLGVQIALDDFGKGYSSLSYLKQLPISTLKIDKSFVDDITQKGPSLTGDIVRLGKKLGICVVAEGVEQREQLEYLAKHECDKIQGYIFSRPVPEDQLEALLQKSAVLYEQLGNEIMD